MKINNVLSRPILTEKSFSLTSSDKYMFVVDLAASKGSIADEIHNLFGVDVIDVRTIIMPGKKKRIPKTSRFTKTAKIKKAIVTVKKGQKIDLVEEKKA
jgi:large subunit ribosomal protein L23